MKYAPDIKLLAKMLMISDYDNLRLIEQQYQNFDYECSLLFLKDVFKEWLTYAHIQPEKQYTSNELNENFHNLPFVDFRNWKFTISLGCTTLIIHQDFYNNDEDHYLKVLHEGVTLIDLRWYYNSGKEYRVISKAVDMLSKWYLINKQRIKMFGI